MIGQRHTIISQSVVNGTNMRRSIQEDFLIHENVLLVGPPHPGGPPHEDLLLVGPPHVGVTHRSEQVGSASRLSAG